MSIATKVILVLLIGFLLACTVASFFIVKSIARHSENRNKYAVFAVALCALFSAVLFAKMFVFLPLPSDEKMIKHFNGHRSEIEFLVNKYREFDRISTPGSVVLWDSDAEIKKIKKKAKVKRIVEKDAFWHDVPYSRESAEEFDRKVKALEINPFTNHRFSSIVVIFEDSESSSLREDAILWKTLYFVPKTPKIENKKLLLPVRGGVIEKSGGSIELREKLDTYPSKWRGLECFLRPVDTQWFLQICKST